MLYIERLAGSSKHLFRNLIDVAIFAEFEEFREVEVALVIHEFLSLVQDDGDKDHSVENKNQAVKIKPVFLSLTIDDL